jgi:hypothetical protein
MSNSSRLQESCKDAGYETNDFFDDFDISQIIDELNDRVIKAEKAIETLKNCKKCRKQIKN